MPDELILSSEDIRRGYVDIEGAVLTARCNLPKGFLLLVHMDPGLVTGATAKGLGSDMHLHATTGVLRVQGPHTTETRYELRWRLKLAPGARAGVHPWPIELQGEGA